MVKIIKFDQTPMNQSTRQQCDDDECLSVDTRKYEALERILSRNGQQIVVFLAFSELDESAMRRVMDKRGHIYELTSFDANALSAENEQ